MKNLATIVLFIFLSQFLFAQSISNFGKHEIGFNVNVLLGQTIFKSEEDAVVLNQAFEIPEKYSTVATYRYYYSENFALRTGLGFYFQESSDTFSSVFSTLFLTESHQLFSTNFGIQRQKKLGKKVQAYAGMELIYRNKKSIQEGKEFFMGFVSQERDFIDTFTKNIIGLGVPIGIQFYFSDKISISTESNVETLVTFSKEEYKDLGQNESFISNKTRQTNLNFRIPIALFINFRF